MNKYFSLIKAVMSEGMNIYKVSTKNKKKSTKILLPIVLTLFIMFVMYSYSEAIIKELHVVNMEVAVLTLFIIITSFLTVIEGIYKSGNLLFNCKDDNLLLSLPIRKSTVLFVRMIKFYIFELAYNSLFLVPAIIAYAVYLKPDITYYIVSVAGIIVFPIVPILISCFIGTFITFISSNFKGKRMVQTLLTFMLLLGIMYFSFNNKNLMSDIANNANNINSVVTKLYYPAGAYIGLIQNFNILKLFEFIVVNFGLFMITVLLVGKTYFKINSNSKSIKTNILTNSYKIKTSGQIKSLIKKELNRFVNSTVFITNAGFGLVLFILGCILITIKFESFAEIIIQTEPTIDLEYITSNIPVILFGLIGFSSFMTSITSSMISLEGKSFNILKSLPIKPYTIIKAKILTALLIMIPCFFIGDLIIFIRFSFDILSIILILIASVLFPLLSETIGIMVNLKYPRMDAQNDTEIVKQSMSSFISVIIGMALTGITVFLLFKALIEYRISQNIILLTFISICGIVDTILMIILSKTCSKSFNNIVV